MSTTDALLHLYRVQELDLNLDRLRDEESHISEDLNTARQEQERLNNELEDAEILLDGI